MAKKAKAKESGPGVFLIITLVFFVLATVILGVTTYLGFEEAGKAEADAKSAAEKTKAAEKNAQERLAERNVLRIAMGTQDPEDQDILSVKEVAPIVLAEHNRLTSKLGANAFPTRDAFNWPLMNEIAKSGSADGDPKPSPTPSRTIPAITKLWAKMYSDQVARTNAEITARQRADAAVKAGQDANEKAKEAFDTKMADLTAQVKAKVDAMDKAFVALKTEADKRGVDYKNQATTWAEEKQKLDDVIAQLRNDLKAKEAKIKSQENPDTSDLLFKFSKLDLAKISEAMGIVAEKSDTFITINFTKPLNLVPGQTFVVIPPTGSLVEVMEREKALETHHHTVLSLGAREPFADNEMIKGMVEITDVTSRTSARARITMQVNAVRNPIGKGDQLFNIALSTGEKEHVAFAGIIDLDGDGRPNNEEFVRILEKNNLVIDAYLDLKSGEIKKRGSTGMDFKTKFLVIGSDAPSVGKIREMLAEAKEKGIQVIDARKFLSLIGVKPPVRPAPPAYATVNIGGDGEKGAKDPEAPMPKEEPKKN